MSRKKDEKCLEKLNFLFPARSSSYTSDVFVSVEIWKCLEKLNFFGVLRSDVGRSFSCQEKKTRSVWKS